MKLSNIDWNTNMERNVSTNRLVFTKACWVEADEKSEEFKEFARLKQGF